MSAVALRPMRWWDIEPVSALEVELFPSDPWSAGGFWSELGGVPSSRTYLVAEAGGRLVGYAGLSAVPPEADVQTLAVATDAQGRGVGAVLLRALLQDAVARGCREVLLEVREDNGPARALYERHAFEPVGRRRGYYGPGRDALLMRWRPE